MRQIFELWWRKNTRCFSAYDYRQAWNEAGVRPRVHFHTNGAKRRNGDRCFDASLVLGYVIINYTNYDLQRSYVSRS